MYNRDTDGPEHQVVPSEPKNAKSQVDAKQCYWPTPGTLDLSYSAYWSLSAVVVKHQREKRNVDLDPTSNDAFKFQLYSLTDVELKR